MRRGEREGGSAVELVGHLAPLDHDGTNPVFYRLCVGSETVPLNPLLGKNLSLVFLREIACRHCGRKVKKTYNNGYCYPCFTRLAENDLCIVKPHLCITNKEPAATPTLPAAIASCPTTSTSPSPAG